MGLLHSFSTPETPHPASEDSEIYAEVLAGLYRDVSAYRHRVDELHKQVEAYRQANDRLIHYLDANGGVEDVIDTVASHQVVADLKVVVGRINEITEAEARIATQLEQLYSLNREELNTTGLIKRINEAESVLKRRVEGLAQQLADLQVLLNLRFDGQSRFIDAESKKGAEALAARSTSLEATLAGQSIDHQWRHEVEVKGINQVRWLVAALIVLNLALLGLIGLA